MSPDTSPNQDSSTAAKRQKTTEDVVVDLEENNGEDLVVATKSTQKLADEGADRRLPVTVLSGFLGSGKTTTLTHILNNTQGLKIAMIVNDMASVNVDSLQIDKVISSSTTSTTSSGHLQHNKQNNPNKHQTVKPKMVSLQNGCVCCTLREDLVEQIAELANDKTANYDYLIIESTGIAEPVPIAQTFCHSIKELEEIARGDEVEEEEEEVVDEKDVADMKDVDDASRAAGKKGGEQVVTDGKGARVLSEEERKLVATQAIQLQKCTRLDTMVTVVDAACIWEVLQSKESIKNSKWTVAEAEASIQEEEAMLAGGGGQTQKTKTTSASDDKEGASTGKSGEVEEQRPHELKNNSDLNQGIAGLLIAQIEFANVILLNKEDLLVESVQRELDQAKSELEIEDSTCLEYKKKLIENLVTKLNPAANLYWTDHGKVACEKILNTNLFDIRTAETQAGWMHELLKDDGTGKAAKLGKEQIGANTDACMGTAVQAERYGISSVIFRASKPFHPKKLFDLLNGFGKISDHAFKPPKFKELCKPAATEENIEEPPVVVKKKCCGSSKCPKNQQNKQMLNQYVKKDDKELQFAAVSTNSAGVEQEEPQKGPAVLAAQGQETTSVNKKNLTTSQFNRSAIFNGVIRSKGQIWLANACGYRMDWHSVGRQFSLNPGQPFESAMREAGVESPEELFLQQEEKTAFGHGGGRDGDNATTQEDEENSVAFILERKKLLKQKELSELQQLKKYEGLYKEQELKTWAIDRTSCTELVLIGIDLDEEKIVAALNSSLISDEEFAKATQEKAVFDAFVERFYEQDEENENEELLELDEETIKQNCNGNSSGFDAFLELEDPFFNGEAAERFMEFDASEFQGHDDDEDGEDGSSEDDGDFLENDEASEEEEASEICADEEE